MAAHIGSGSHVCLRRDLRPPANVRIQELRELVFDHAVNLVRRVLFQQQRLGDFAKFLCRQPFPRGLWVVGRYGAVLDRDTGIAEFPETMLQKPVLAIRIGIRSGFHRAFPQLVEQLRLVLIGIQSTRKCETLEVGFWDLFIGTTVIGKLLAMLAFQRVMTFHLVFLFRQYCFPCFGVAEENAKFIMESFDKASWFPTEVTSKIRDGVKQPVFSAFACLSEAARNNVLRKLEAAVHDEILEMTEHKHKFFEDEWNRACNRQIYKLTIKSYETVEAEGYFYTKLLATLSLKQWISSRTSLDWDEKSCSRIVDKGIYESTFLEIKVTKFRAANFDSFEFVKELKNETFHRPGPYKIFD